MTTPPPPPGGRQTGGIVSTLARVTGKGPGQIFELIKALQTLAPISTFVEELALFAAVLLFDRGVASIGTST